MTDFAAKYGFALQDSDSEEDGPAATTAAGMFGGSAPPGGQAQQSAASALFGDAAGDTASYFASAPPVAQDLRPAAAKEATAPPVPVVKVTTKVPEPPAKPAPSAKPPATSGRINTLLQGLLDDSDEDSDADDFLAKYRASRMQAANTDTPKPPSKAQEPAQPEQEAKVATAAAMFAEHRDQEVEPPEETKDRVESLGGTTSPLIIPARRPQVVRVMSEQPVAEQDGNRVNEEAKRGEPALTFGSERAAPYSEHPLSEYSAVQAGKSELSGPATEAPPSEDPGPAPYALPSSQMTLGADTRAQTLDHVGHNVADSPLEESKQPMTAANLFAFGDGQEDGGSEQVAWPADSGQGDSGYSPLLGST